MSTIERPRADNQTSGRGKRRPYDWSFTIPNLVGQLDGSDTLKHRLRNQHLIGPPAPTPDAVVRELLAVQAQDYAGAKWGVGQRAKNATDAKLDSAYNDGKILRTHVMRPTWHFVARDDMRWLLELTAPRVRALMAYYDRNLEIDKALRTKSANVLTKALRDNRYLTRTEISRAYAAAGIEATGQRLGHIVMHAELDGLVCSGPLRGKQFTYALLDERAPNTRGRRREDALAELALRFFTGHGPATVKDLAWWSGLTQGDARRGVALMKDHLESESVDGKAFYFASSSKSARFTSPVIHLLPNYDEYLIAYRENDAVLDRDRYPAVTTDDLSAHFIALDGRIVGGWRRNVTKDGITTRVSLFGPLDKAAKVAINDEFKRYARFLSKEVEVNLRSRRL